MAYRFENHKKLTFIVQTNFVFQFYDAVSCADWPPKHFLYSWCCSSVTKHVTINKNKTKPIYLSIEKKNKKQWPIFFWQMFILNSTDLILAPMKTWMINNE